MTDAVDAAIRRYMAAEADQLRVRQEQRLAAWLWGADMIPPGGPFQDAFKTGQARSAMPADTGNTNRHRRRRNAAKARH